MFQEWDFWLLQQLARVVYRFWKIHAKTILWQIPAPRSYKYLSLSSLSFDSLTPLLLYSGSSPAAGDHISLIFIFTTSVYPVVSRKWVLANEGPIKVCQTPCCGRTGPWWQPHLTALWLHLLKASDDKPSPSRNVSSKCFAETFRLALVSFFFMNKIFRTLWLCDHICTYSLEVLPKYHELFYSILLPIICLCIGNPIIHLRDVEARR